MSRTSFVIDLKLKIQRNKWPFLFCFLFWLSGFIALYFSKDTLAFWEILIISLGFQSPSTTTLYIAIFIFIWPILVEVIIISFIFGTLLEKFNPVITSRLVSSHNSDHTIVIGYHHLGIRIVDYLRENNKPYSLIEDDEELVEDLINHGEPVVIGNPTDDENLKYAAIEDAKEVFILSNQPREAIVLCEKIRQVNKECALYVRLFGEYYYDYLAKPPIKAYSFSTSKWALDSIKDWTKSEEESVVVIGRDNLTLRIVDYLANEQKRKVFLIDPKIDKDLFDQEENIEVFEENVNHLRLLEDIVDLKEISQIFICWKKEVEFSDSIHLAIRLYQDHPDIKIYIRIFDEELLNIMKKYNVFIFSTSSYAFKMLQKEVKSDSALFE